MRHVNVFKVSLKYVSNDIDLTISSIKYIYFANNIGVQTSLNIIERQHIQHCTKYWI